MASLSSQRCSVCSAPLLNDQKWAATKDISVRSTSAKRNTSKTKLNRPCVTQCDSPCIDLENEYIKQLKQQNCNLERECQYLRDQLNRNSTLINRSHQAEKECDDLQRSLIQTSSQFEQVTSENHGLTIALDELRRKFDIEKQKLIEELNNLLRIKETLERERSSNDKELRDLRDRSRLSADEIKKFQGKIRILEQQFEQQLNENKNLNNELQHCKLESNNLQRKLNDQQIIFRDRDRLQGIVTDLERQIQTLRQDLKAHDNRYNEGQILRNKLINEKDLLNKEIIRLNALGKESGRELEELRLALRDRTDALQLKEREFLTLRKSEQNCRSVNENIQRKLENEVLKNKDLDGQIAQLQRELNIEIQNSLNSKRDIDQCELRITRLQDQINTLQNEKDHLTSHINSLQQSLNEEENLSNKLRIEMGQLDNRVREIDRLKSIEDLIQSQRWGDISQMAETMQTVSRTMARATSPTPSRRKRVELK